MDLLHIIDQLNYLIGHSAGQWWIIPLVSVFCLIDGFFLFLPSETAIVALASIAARTGEPNIWLLIIGTSMGAMVGDNIAYFMGRKLGVSRFRWMRQPRGAKAFAWAGRELEKRGAILIFTARYIPVGRIAVNFTAGATYFPWRRFVIIDSIAVVTWASYSVAVGTFAGRWVHHNPLLGIAIAIVFAIVIGFFVDHAMKYLHRFLEKRGRLAPRPEPGLGAAEHAARVQAETAWFKSARETTATEETAGGISAADRETSTRTAGKSEGKSSASTPAESPAVTPAESPAVTPAETSAVNPAETSAESFADNAPECAPESGARSAPEDRAADAAESAGHSPCGAPVANVEYAAPTTAEDQDVQVFSKIPAKMAESTLRALSLCIPAPDRHSGSPAASN